MIEVDFTGVKGLLKGMMDTIKDPDSLLESSCGPILRESFEKQFSRGGLPDPWTPLKPNTIAQKQYQGWPRRNRLGGIPGYTTQNGNFGPQNILIKTGSLRISWTREDHPFHVCRALDGVLTIGSSLPWAVFHQSTEPRKKIPRRPLTVDDGDLAKCAVAIVLAIVNGPSHVSSTNRRRK